MTFPRHFSLIILLISSFVLMLGGNAQGALRINEVSGANDWSLRDSRGEYPDWVEIYHTGSVALNVGGYRLGKSQDGINSWAFPNTVVEPGERLVLLASGENRIQGNEWHLSFRISSGGDILYLFDPTGKVVDQTPFSGFPTDVSLGRYPDGTGPWFYHEIPTPGLGNRVSSTTLLLDPPGFSHRGGHFDDPIDLGLSHGDSNVVIRYTLDGSVPGPESPRYTEPIRIDSRRDNPDVLSLIPVGLEDEGVVPRKQGMKGTVVRARAFAEGALPSQTITRTFFVDEDPWDLYGLPVVSLVVDPIDFFDDDGGLYVRGNVYHMVNELWEERYPDVDRWAHPANFKQRGRVRFPLTGLEVGVSPEGLPSLHLPNHGLELNFSLMHEAPIVGIRGAGEWDGDYFYHESSTPDVLVLEAPMPSGPFPPGAQLAADWERPVHFEIHESGGGVTYQQNLGVRIHGNISRVESQKPLRFYARNSYDTRNEVNYPLVNDRIDRYRRFIMRRGIEDAGITCIISTQLISQFNPLLEVQAYRNVSVFLNGEFWGYMALRDRLDEWHISNRFGIDTDQFAILEHGWGELLHGKDADRLHYLEMRDLILRGDIESMETIEAIDSMMDLNAYLDYKATGIFLNYTDWGDKHLMPWRYTGSPLEGGHESLDGRWRWLPFDYDSSFGMAELAPYNFLELVLPDTRYFIGRLQENSEVRRRFINKFADMMNTVFSPLHARALINSVAGEFSDEIVSDHVDRFRRWGDANEWRMRVDTKIRYIGMRQFYMREQLKNEYGLEGTTRLILDADPSMGHIRINGMLVDENLPGVSPTASVYPWEGIYFPGVPVDVEAVPVPGFAFERWEGLSDELVARIQVDPSDEMPLRAIFREANVGTILATSLPPTAQVGQVCRPATVTAGLEWGVPTTGFSGTFRLEVLSGPGPVLGSMTREASSGSATFDDLVFTTPGPHRLRFSTTEFDDTLDWDVDVASIEGTILPLYIQGERPNNNRLPFAFRASIGGLLPDHVYKVANRMVDGDDSATQNGAGNALYPRSDGPGWFRTTDTPDFSTEGTHGTITTDSHGGYTGWFITEPSGNRRFEPGTNLRVRILLNDGRGGTGYHHYLTIEPTVRVLPLGAGPSDATPIVGRGMAVERNFVFLHDDGDLSARPIAGTILEDDGANTDSRYATFYTTMVDRVGGAWGTMIPNTLPGGVRAVAVYSEQDGSLLRVYTSPDGAWPGADTVNPPGAPNVLVIDFLEENDGGTWLLY